MLIKNRLEGIGWFTYETLKRITAEHPNDVFYFVFDRPYSEEFIFSSNVNPIIIGPQARHPVLFYIWFEHSLHRIIRKIQPDLFLSPDGYLSLRSKVRSLPVIHDINFVHHRKDTPWLVDKYYNHFFPKFAQKATRIATVSEYSKNDIAQSFHVNQEKIDVVYNGASDKLHPISEEHQKKIRKKYTDEKPFFIFIGSLHPRKNVERLLKAFDAFKKEHDSDVRLLIVGDRMFKTATINNTYEEMQYKNDVAFFGRASRQELHHLLASALALVFVPYFEGFGIPILEAFHCETPVISANVTSMPEVTGDAALQVDPFSTEQIKNAMMEIYVNQSLRGQLIKKANERKTMFSWDNTAKKLWSSIEQCMD